MIKKGKKYFIKKERFQEAMEALSKNFGGDKLDCIEEEFFENGKIFTLTEIDHLYDKKIKEGDSIRLSMKSVIDNYHFSNYYFLPWIEECFSQYETYEEETMDI
jgi:hypothetical protein